MKRAIDILLSAVLLAATVVPMLLIALAIRLTSKGPVLFWSERVGRDNLLFRMPKFRTMRVEAPEVATRDLTDAGFWITPVGRFLRKSSLDELPQLWNILCGEMSFVGPRPVIASERERLALRTAAGIHRLTPGLTGWAQIHDRIEMPVAEKVRYDIDYFRRRSLLFDLWIMLLTPMGALRRDIVAPTPMAEQASADSTRRAA